jgi:hypothetical protein
VEWSPDKFEIYINFTNPLVISQGKQRDEVNLVVKNPAWFKSAVNGKSIDVNLGALVLSLPRQLPTGVDENELQNQAIAARDSCMSVMIV